MEIFPDRLGGLKVITRAVPGERQEDGSVVGVVMTDKKLER